jgi:hypothetical protein
MRSLLLNGVVLVASLLCQGPNCSAQGFKIRLLDARNARPVANETIRVQFQVPQTPELQTLEEKTDKDGVATFILPDPAPQQISVLDLQLYPCYSRAPVKTQEIFGQGLVSRCSKPIQACRCRFGSQVSSVQTTPGELVILARPFTKSERVLGHVWE